MKISNGKMGITALMSNHCAGMVDIIALPIWIGILISYYQFDTQQAGLLVTLFLIGATSSSIILAPLFNNLPKKIIIFSSFFIAGLAFFLISSNTDFKIIASLHLYAGLAVGAGLSLTHGTVGQSNNPHKLFAVLGMALGVFGIIFMAVAIFTTKTFGPNNLFVLIGIIMIFASLISFLFFPKSHAPRSISNNLMFPKLKKYIWLCIIGISLLSMTQAITVSFFDRIGEFRGFSHEMISIALMIYVSVCILPGPLAVFLQNKLNALTVICIGPLFQALFALIITHTTSAVMYCISGGLMAFTILFTHIFAFGLLSKLDSSNRAIAATPAMLMFGSAIAPILGGTLIKYIGFESIGYAAFVLVFTQICCFAYVRCQVMKSSISSNTLNA
ncbi:MFS transporter [Acinetobacter sp. ANC 3813]|uniref:MFS transporter n=1 Tax=Acinetobacter sp. ANC 3813 TaxID=1977873 RepID=UPI000A348831|nr:MFS transporter [Acinetobacter sp. ANC 3813]OTG87361.1 MFS transporter [Acinetobacter sp. ANC 3813]